MSYKRPLYLLPCKSTIILIKRNILGDNYWVVAVGCWVLGDDELLCWALKGGGGF